MQKFLLWFIQFSSVFHEFRKWQQNWESVTNWEIGMAQKWEKPTDSIQKLWFESKLDQNWSIAIKIGWLAQNSKITIKLINCHKN